MEENWGRSSNVKKIYWFLLDIVFNGIVILDKLVSGFWMVFVSIISIGGLILKVILFF